MEQRRFESDHFFETVLNLRTGDAWKVLGQNYTFHGMNQAAELYVSKLSRSGIFLGSTAVVLTLSKRLEAG